MNKKAYFFIDDVIWAFRDIAAERPKSAFDQQFLKNLKEAHEKYGAKFQLNLFWRTDFYYGNSEFTLAEMPDCYKSEFEANSDWLKFCFHSKQEFPDYPFINATYEDTKAIFKMIQKEVFRFAGENSFTYGATCHWGPASREACRALADCGIKILWATHGETKEYNGDPSSLPYGHAGRLLNNRQPETKIFFRDSRDYAIADSLCGYNHLPTDVGDSTIGNSKAVFDKETGLYFKIFHDVSPLNLLNDETIESDFVPHLNDEFLCIPTHEQYSYPDYFAYQPDHNERIQKICRLMKEAGYEFIFVEDLVK